MTPPPDKSTTEDRHEAFLELIETAHTYSSAFGAVPVILDQPIYSYLGLNVKIVEADLQSVELEFVEVLIETSTMERTRVVFSELALIHPPKTFRSASVERSPSDAR